MKTVIPMIKNRMYELISLLVVTTCVKFFLGCRMVPITERTQLMLTTEDYENACGLTAYDEYLQKYSQSDNAEYNEALLRCVAAISRVAERDDFNWKFVLLDSPIENAFCLPGGKVAFYTGIVDRMENEAEMAFVMGHEIAHAIARHGGERISWGMLTSLGGYLLEQGAASERVRLAYGLGTELGMTKPFSRDNESEADRIGLILMARAGYDPRVAPAFWRRFSAGASSDMLGSLLSTHPCDEERILAMEENMAVAEEEYAKASDKRGVGKVFREGE